MVSKSGVGKMLQYMLQDIEIYYKKPPKKQTNKKRLLTSLGKLEIKLTSLGKVEIKTTVLFASVHTTKTKNKEVLSGSVFFVNLR